MKYYALLLVSCLIYFHDTLHAQDIRIENISLETDNAFNEKLDFQLGFDIVNDSEHDIYVPDPSVTLGSSESPFPKVFSFLMEPNECDFEFLDYEFIGESKLVLIEKNSSKTFSINPKKYEKFNCSFGKGYAEIQLKLSYKLDDRQLELLEFFVGDNETIRNKLLQIPSTTVLSEKIKFNID